MNRLMQHETDDAVLQEHAEGASTADLILRHRISRRTFYHWKKRYGEI